MNRHLVALLVLVVAGALPAARATAAEAKDPFEYLYGADSKRALDSHDPKAIAEFAARLLADADTVIKDPAVKAAVLKKACEFGLMNPQGYATAATAAQRLVTVAPERNAQWQEKLLQVYQAQFKAARSDEERARFGPLVVEQLVLVADLEVAAGQAAKAADNCRQALAIIRLVPADRRDALQAQAKQLAARAAALLQADTLKAQLAADPQSKPVAEKLVRLYLVELDNPEEAAKFAELGRRRGHPELHPRGRHDDGEPARGRPHVADGVVQGVGRLGLRRPQGGDAAAGQDVWRTVLEGPHRGRPAADQGHHAAGPRGRGTGGRDADRAPPVKTTPVTATSAKTPTAPVKAPGPIKFPLRINCGGQEVTDAKKITWLADQAYAPGKTWGFIGNSTAHHRDLEDVPTLFADERIGGIQYRFDVPNRKYTVALGFFDDSSKAVGERVFAISILNQSIEKAFDLYKVANGKRQTMTLNIKNIQVVNGFMTVQLSPVRGTPTLSWIELTPE